MLNPEKVARSQRPGETRKQSPAITNPRGENILRKGFASLVHAIDGYNKARVAANLTAMFHDEQPRFTNAASGFFDCSSALRRCIGGFRIKPVDSNAISLGYVSLRLQVSFESGRP